MRSVNKAGTKEPGSAMKGPELIYAYQPLVALLSRSAGIRRMPHTEKISGPCFSLVGLEKIIGDWEIHNPVTISAVLESNSLLRAFRLRYFQISQAHYNL